MYYAIILFSTVLFSMSFFMTKGYQRNNGSGLAVAMKFAMQTGAVSFFIMLALAKFQLAFSWFSLGMALVNAAIVVLSTYCQTSALKTANLSVFSVFMMLGGMLLPSLCGILFYGEAVTVGKLVCCALILVALFLTVEKESSSRKAYKYYIGCFLLNGLAATVAKVHQSGSTAVNSQIFLAMTNLFTVLFCLLYLLCKDRKLLQLRIMDLKFTAGNAVFNGMANLLLLIALMHVDASVQYPLVTGGVIIFSALITLITEKRISKKNILALGFAFLAAIFVIL